MESAINLGADVVAECSYNELSFEDTCSHIDKAFDLAQKRGLALDMNVDFADDRQDGRFAATEYIARKTIDTGYHGRVALGHVTSLGSLRPDELKPIIELLREADIHIVTLPATDTYLRGRRDEANPRRGRRSGRCTPRA